MKILLISPHFWPANDPRSNRWTALTQHWAEKGHELLVLTAKYGGQPTNQYRKGVHICRKAYKKPEDFFFHPKQRHQARRKNRFQLLYRLNKTFWKPLHWPDASALWYLPARREAFRMIKTFQPDRLISVALPITAHAVALAVKKRYPKLPWLADWGDPFSLQKLCPPNNRRVYQHLNIWLEQQIFKQAETLTFTAETTLKAYVNLFPQASAKCQLIPPLINPEQDFSAFAKYQPPEKNQPLRMAYFGGFSPKLREPLTALRLLQALLNRGGRSFTLQIYGRLPEPLIKQIRAFSFVQYQGLISATEVVQKMAQADLLLSIGNRSALHLPSKSVEYLRAPKPVLHIQQVKNDPVMQVFQNTPGFLSLAAQEPAFTQIEIWLKNFQALSPKEALDRKQKAEKYNIKNIASAYEDLLFRQKAMSPER